jgi:peptidoglycan/xylan/chitin deacetylase (PgdA/CDA1 family)
MMDRSYHRESAAEFKADFQETERILSRYRSDSPPWYRAPFGRMSRIMQRVLGEHGYAHVLCDCFANDTAIPDPDWIARFILRRVRPGSIILIHMPERGCRQWNLKAMELTLSGLSRKGLRVVNFSELDRMQVAQR